MAANGDTYDLMHLNLEADYGLIRTSTDQAIGVLNDKLFQALLSCMAGEHFQIDVWVPSEEWFAKESHAQGLSTNNRKIVILKVDLILFGPDQARNKVATSLGGSKIYLQDPHMGLFQHPYDNPQSLDIPELPVEFQTTTETTSTGFMTEDASEAEDEVGRSREGNSSELHNLIADIDSLLEASPVHKPIIASTKNARMISTLFSYQHTITGAKSESPEGFMGGILADDMGLGKTLTTLTLIVTSIDRDGGFISQSSRQVRRVASSKASVIIVPSECKPVFYFLLRESSP
ncbi:unnamed protein product [Clonostachys byssicola]|uniref:SNF2 N-terminal domain-containing protein n=1 Tax=Clonostachys byssicola TaxID=160290 RepID=A0A9N9U6Q9_9HYPO|nr:unnamed protein product [Clonostachys byssicola]